VLSSPQHPPSWLPILEELPYPCIPQPGSRDVFIDRSGWLRSPEQQAGAAGNRCLGEVGPTGVSLAGSWLQ